MNILVTGSGGFIGRNLIEHLRQRGYKTIMKYDIDTEPELLNAYASLCDFVFHLAGVNRPKDNSEFMRGNADFTRTLLEKLEQYGNRAPVLAASSVQAALDNPYGQSKKAMETLLFSRARKTGSPVFVYRLPNVFGKWCKPGYNSAVATFCYNSARGIPVTVNDRESVMNLVHIGDVAEEFISALQGNARRDGEFCAVENVYTATLGRIIDLIQSFRAGRSNLRLPDLSDDFVKKLYSTYVSYLPEDGFDYPLKANADSRGSFTEFLRADSGQMSVSVSVPGSVKGNHWHHTKHEKFLVVSGEGVVRFRAPESGRVIEVFVNGSNPRVVDIPPGYTHNIENTGIEDMITLIWANECYDPQNPDTHILEV